jgi:transposase
MAAYSLDLRRRILRACDEEMETRQETAERFGVSVSFIIKLRRRRRETGSVAARPHAGGRPAALDGDGLEVLDALVRRQPDATLEELREALRRRFGACPSKSALSRCLQQVRLPRKKSRFRPASAIPLGSSG